MSRRFPVSLISLLPRASPTSRHPLWPPGGLPALLLQMAGKVLVHLEHRHRVLAEDPPEVIVRQNFASVLWVLQVVQANVLPHLAHHLSPGAAGASRPPRLAPATQGRMS